MIDFRRMLGALSSEGVLFVIAGGVAATIHGSARLTSDLDIIYERSSENIEHLVSALSPLAPYLRGAPPGLPFRFDERTIVHGLNFTLTTDAGPIDLFGEMTGIGSYGPALERSIEVVLFGERCRCLDLDSLILAKRSAGRPKDLEVIAELEAIREESAGGGRAE